MTDKSLERTLEIATKQRDIRALSEQREFERNPENDKPIRWRFTGKGWAATDHMELRR